MQFRCFRFYFISREFLYLTGSVLTYMYYYYSLMKTFIRFGAKLYQH